MSLHNITDKSSIPGAQDFNLDEFSTLYGGFSNNNEAIYKEAKKKREDEEVALSLDIFFKSLGDFSKAIFENNQGREYFDTLDEKGWYELFERYRETHASLYKGKHAVLHLGTGEGEIWEDEKIIEEYPQTTQASKRVTLTPFSQIKEKTLQWSWKGFLPLGKLALMAGPPGLGKSLLSLKIAATISVGGIWPDGTKASTGNVLIWSSEDAVDDTIKPRLLKMGADVNKIFFVDNVSDEKVRRPFMPSIDMPYLAEAAKEIGNVSLIIVDPIISMVLQKSHQAAEVRQQLQPIVDLATETGATVLGLTHFTKGTSGKNPLERVTSSLSFGAMARVVMATFRDEMESIDAPRYMMRVKGNNGPSDGGFSYRTHKDCLDENPLIEAEWLEWGDYIEGSAWQLMSEIEAHQKKEANISKLDDAMEWLQAKLTNGPLLATEIYEDAKQLVISTATLRRAKEKMGVQDYKDRDTKKSMWKLKG